MNESKKSQESLEDKLKQFSLAFARLHDSILITDSNFKIVSVNKPFEEMYGYTLEDVLGKTPDVLNAEPMTEANPQEIYDAIARNDVWQGSTLSVRKDGSRFVSELTASALIDEQGKPFAYVGTQRDITEKKKAEEAMKTAYTAIELSPSATFTSDLEGKVTYANVAAARMWGFENPADMVGTEVMDYWTKKSQEKAKEIVGVLMKEGSYSGEGLIGKRKDGTEFIIEANSVILRDNSGKPIKHDRLFYRHYRKKEDRRRNRIF